MRVEDEREDIVVAFLDALNLEGKPQVSVGNSITFGQESRMFLFLGMR